MTIDFLQIADLLRDELEQFFHVVRRTEDVNARQAAARQLQSTLDRVAVFADDPGDQQWIASSEPQRWGYLWLVSHVGTAMHELQQFERWARTVQGSNLVFMD